MVEKAIRVSDLLLKVVRAAAEIVIQTTLSSS